MQAGSARGPGSRDWRRLRAGRACHQGFGLRRRPTRSSRRWRRNLRAGCYPRGFFGEQTYWTCSESMAARKPACCPRMARWKSARGGFTIEPFVVAGQRLVTWADVTTSQSLASDYLPDPERHLAARRNGACARPRLRARHAAKRPSSSRAISVREPTPTSRNPCSWCWRLRPFQVNPPTQFLNTSPAASVRSNRSHGTATSCRSTARRALSRWQPPDRFAATAFEAGSLPQKLLEPGVLAGAPVTDASGFASGAFVYQLELAPHESRTVGIVASLQGETAKPDLAGTTPQAWLDAQQREVEAGWRDRLDRVEFEVPPHGQRTGRHAAHPRSRIFSCRATGRCCVRAHALTRARGSATGR